MIIHVRVKTNSPRQKMEKLDEGKFLIHLKSIPKNNKANTELINLISKKFGVSNKSIKIKFGKTSNKKIVEIE